MADVDFTPDPSSQPTKQNALGFLPGFLYKSFFIVVLLFLLPMFPSQAPEFVNQTILTRSWELIHLLLVGIAVSYGLFSRRNADPTAEKDLLQGTDASQSYVSDVLRVASVFDEDEAVMAPVVGGKKAQVWSSRYHRGNSTVVVEPENSGDRRETNRPLFLPVRSLKSKVSDPEPIIADQAPHGPLGPCIRSEVPEVATAEAREHESVVLPSPIPWRSRSGRMDVKAESGVFSAPLSDSAPPPASPVLRSHSFQSRRTRRASPSPSPELRTKNVEDSVQNRSFKKPSTPPPPPPPPPPHFAVHKSQYSTGHISQTKTSFKDELKDVKRSGGGREPKPSPTFEATTFPGTRIPLHNSGPPAAPVLKAAQAERKNGSSRKFIIDSSSSSDSDGDRAPNSSTDGEEEEDGSYSGVELETDVNEVDRKADEFIAKFREQIRLQRIESIKRSTVQKRGTRSAQE